MGRDRRPVSSDWAVGKITDWRSKIPLVHWEEESLRLSKDAANGPKETVKENEIRQRSGIKKG